MNDKSKLNRKQTLFIQFCIVAIIVAGYFFIDINSIYNSLRGDTEFIVQNSKCDLSKTPCEIEIQDGSKLTLEIFPKHLPLMKPLRFKVLSSNKNLKNLKLKIYATNMIMGEYILDLKTDGNGVYEAKATLPTCSVGFMKWNADVEVYKLDTIIGARFKFETKI